MLDCQRGGYLCGQQLKKDPVIVCQLSPEGHSAWASVHIQTSCGLGLMEGIDLRWHLLVANLQRACLEDGVCVYHWRCRSEPQRLWTITRCVSEVFWLYIWQCSWNSVCSGLECTCGAEGWTWQLVRARQGQMYIAWHKCILGSLFISVIFI